MSGFVLRRASEALGAALCVAALLLAVALLGHDANDPSLNHATAAASRNPLGPLGALVADLGLQTLGDATWLLILVLPAWGVRLMVGRSLPLAWLSVAALPPALLAGAAFLATRDVPADWPYRVGLGGVVGDFALHRLEPALGSGGYVFWSGLLALALVVVAIGASWREVGAGATGLAGLIAGAGARERRPGGQAPRLRGAAAPAPAGPGWLATGIAWLGRRFQRSRTPRVITPQIAATENGGFRLRRRGADAPAEAAGPPPRFSRLRQAPAELRPEPKAAPSEPAAEPTELTPASEFQLPPLKFLAQPRKRDRVELDAASLRGIAQALEKVLDDFGVRGAIVAVKPGPVVTLYELEPAPGTRAARVVSLADDIARSLCAMSVRVATVPGRNVIGIELPNDVRETVYLRDLLAASAYEDSSATLSLALGKDISGEPVAVDLARMPHLLIAGTTGSGKSVAINAMILSLLYRLPPVDCRLIMIDPKVIELSVYDGIPHLLAPVVTEPHKAVVALKWVVRQMDDRYRLMSHLGVRDIASFNRRMKEAIARGEQLSRRVQTGFEPGTGVPIFEQQPLQMATLPLIVVIVDEVADLMLTAGKEIEGAIQRLSQKARAAGIHLIVATQRPSVDVLTGVIKANLPARISFRVSSKIDSRTILGEPGAEQLLGQGDMLHLIPGERILRIHGPLVTDEEVERVVAHLKSQGAPDYLDAITDETLVDGAESPANGGAIEVTGSEDAQYAQALQIVAKEGRASTSFLQRKLRIGYNSAARLIERMEQDGHVSEPDHVGRRKVLMGAAAEDGDTPW
jgi:S-DNA-T family DNA segregation ATPase FtsK/SpoIIIE